MSNHFEEEKPLVFFFLHGESLRHFETRTEKFCFKITPRNGKNLVTLKTDQPANFLTS